MKLNVEDLVEKGLINKKTYTEGRYKGLSILKYHRKVFYKNLWNLDKRLLEARGTVIDEDNNIVVLPFKKVFNVGENGTEIEPTRELVCPVKVNGYMLAVTKTEKYGVIVSTTGSLDSDFVKLGEKWVDTLNKDSLVEGHTLLFEVCDKTDPHIVEEKEGIYLIGVREHSTGLLLSESYLDWLSHCLGAKRLPYITTRFEALDKNVLHEGYMLRDKVTGETLAKLKTKHYLSKKALMRVGKAKVDILYDNPTRFKQRLDEEFYDFVDWLVSSIDKEDWRSYNDQERRVIIEGYYNDK